MFIEYEYRNQPGVAEFNSFINAGTIFISVRRKDDLSKISTFLIDEGLKSFVSINKYYSVNHMCSSYSTRDIRLSTRTEISKLVFDTIDRSIRISKNLF